VTEEDARSKWCPFARVAIGVGPIGGSTTGYTVFNRATTVGEAPLNAMCLGSACMAWRVRAAADGKGGWKGDGYCGLAGGA
jgi:hypothetical protein